MESNSKSTGHKKRRDEEDNKKKDKKEGDSFVDINDDESDEDIIKTNDEIAVKLDNKKMVARKKE